MGAIQWLEVVGQCAGLVVGGGAVSTWWAWRADRLAQYRYLDEMYSTLLAQYRALPHFGDPYRTCCYADAYEPDHADAYHYFAMTVHNTMETIFDVTRKRPLAHAPWSAIFTHHVRLHAAWLLANKTVFEPAYVAYVERRVLIREPEHDDTTAPLPKVTAAGIVRVRSTQAVSQN